MRTSSPIDSERWWMLRNCLFIHRFQACLFSIVFFSCLHFSRRYATSVATRRFTWPAWTTTWSACAPWPIRSPSRSSRPSRTPSAFRCCPPTPTSWIMMVCFGVLFVFVIFSCICFANQRIPEHDCIFRTAVCVCIIGNRTVAPTLPAIALSLSFNSTITCDRFELNAIASTLPSPTWTDTTMRRCGISYSVNVNWLASVRSCWTRFVHTCDRIFVTSVHGLDNTWYACYNFFCLCIQTCDNSTMWFVESHALVLGKLLLILVLNP